MHQNVLITSAGRRGKLVAAFRRELANLLPGARVFAADMRPELSAGCRLADAAFAVPAVDDSDYIARLFDLCLANRIGLVVPTIDPELPILAGCRVAFGERGIHVVVSDPAFVDTCRDKRKLVWWFSERGLRTPRVFDVHSIASFPVFAKPYDGSGSRDARVIERPSDLPAGVRNDPRMMYVEYLSPQDHDEYTVDMYYNRYGRLRCLVPRQRLETRAAGEVSKARIRRISLIHELLEQLEQIDGVRGCITLQLFVRRRTAEAYAIEINPRFGGGFPLSYEAGANFPAWLIREYLQSQPIEFFNEWEDDLTMLRYDDHVLVRGAVA